MTSPSIERKGRTASTVPRQTLRDSWASHWDSAVTSYYLMVGASALLLVLGLVMVLSGSSVDSLAAGDSPYKVFLNQAQFALMGLPLMIVASRIRPGGYRRIAWPALAVAIFLQLLIFTPLAVGTKGNLNWISLGPGLTIQPSEFSKVALAVWLGVVLARKQDLLHDWKHVAIPAGPAVGVVVGLVMVGKDLGTALIFVLLVAGALFVAGVPMRIFTVLAVATAGLVAIAASTSNRAGRIFAIFGGETADPSGIGYQTQRGLEALGSGGFAGVGLGASREKWSYLPEAHNDFIFAVIGEEARSARDAAGAAALRDPRDRDGAHHPSPPRADGQDHHRSHRLLDHRPGPHQHRRGHRARPGDRGPAAAGLGRWFGPDRHDAGPRHRHLLRARRARCP